MTRTTPPSATVAVAVSAATGGRREHRTALHQEKCENSRTLGYRVSASGGQERTGSLRQCSVGVLGQHYSVVGPERMRRAGTAIAGCRSHEQCDPHHVDKVPVVDTKLP